MPLTLARPFVVDHAVDPGALDLTPNAFGGYSDPAAANEFRRFIFRDLVGDFVAAIYGLLAFPYVSLNLIVVPAAQAYLFAAHIPLVLVGLVVDVYFVMVAETFTHRHATIRMLLACLYMLVSHNTGSWYLTEMAINCGDAADFFALIFPSRNGVDKSTAAVERGCVRVVQPYTASAIVLGVGAIRAFPPVLSGVVALVIVTYSLGFLNIDLADHGMATREILAVYIVYVYLACAIAMVGRSRFRLFRAQFEAALEAERQTRAARAAADDVDRMLTAMLPASALARLLAGKPVEDATGEASVLFSDMKGFTAWSSTRTAAEVVSMLNTLCVALDAEAAAEGVEKVKTIGDAYWAMSGLPEAVADHAVRMVGFGRALHRIVATNARSHPEWGHVTFRVGIASGQLQAAVFSSTRISYECFGATSALAMLAEQNGVPGRVAVTAETLAMLASEEQSAVERVEVTECVTPTGTSLTLFVLASECVDLSDSVTHQSTTSARRRSVARITDTHSAASSAIHVDTAAAKADQAQRRAFLAARAKRDAPDPGTVMSAGTEDGSADDGDLEAFEEHLTARRYPFFLLRFDDDATEEAYAKFVFAAHKPMRSLTRWLTVGLFAALFVAVLVEFHTWSIASVVLYVLGLALAVVLAVVDLPGVADGLLLHVAFALLIAALWTLPDSAVSVDLTYMIPACAFLLMNGVVGLPAVVLIVLYCAVVAVPVAVQARMAIMLTGTVAFGILLTITLSLTVFGFEKLYRRQFVEAELARRGAQLQAARQREQHVLLEALVPAHVIAPLTEWLRGSDAARPVYRLAAHASVGFIRLEAPTTTGDVAWLFAAHKALDEALGDQSEFFDAIKTMGDTVMIAGCLSPDGIEDAPTSPHSRNTPMPGAASADAAMTTTVASRAQRNAAVAMLVATLDLYETGTSFKAGFHTGETMGAVLGTERLCFDVFGDTVNTASRVMTGIAADTAAGFRVNVSCSFKECAECTVDQPLNGAGTVALPSSLSFGMPEEREAKGKGTLTVYPVQRA